MLPSVRAVTARQPISPDAPIDYQTIARMPAGRVRDGDWGDNFQKVVGRCDWNPLDSTSSDRARAFPLF